MSRKLDRALPHALVCAHASSVNMKSHASPYGYRPAQATFNGSAPWHRGTRKGGRFVALRPSIPRVMIPPSVLAKAATTF